MRGSEHLWAVVLAAEDGSGPIPRQYCYFPESHSFLRGAIERAAHVVSRDHIMVVVASQHRDWWETELADIPAENIVIQPRSRGTAAELLLPLMILFRRDPQANLVVLPACLDVEHEREEVLRASLEQAALVLEGEGARVVLLGVSPEEPDPDADWIVPANDTDSRWAGRIEAFVDSPGAALANQLVKDGGLLNSLIVAGSARALVRLYDTYLPALPWLFEDALRYDTTEGRVALEALYGVVGTSSFSRDVLEPSVEALRVITVPRCGWTDLRTPRSVERAMERFRAVAI